MARLVAASKGPDIASFLSAPDRMGNTNAIDSGVGVRKSGVYGLFRLDGGPIDLRNAQALGLSPSNGMAAPLVEAVDVHAPHALHRHEDAQALTVLAGDIEDAAELADRLGVARATPHALLARAALERFAGDTPAEMIGEWSLVHRDRGGVVTLMLSAARRDPLLYALSGPHLAVSPDLFRLARINWIGEALDEAGLIARVAGAKMRRSLGGRTMLAHVRELAAGGSVFIDAAGSVRKHVARVLNPQPRWSGSFEDLLAEAERLMLHIMRSRLVRAKKVAPLLSGGLDSSLLAWFAAEAHPSDVSLTFLTSVAPPGSGLPDEAAFADAVVRRLGLPSQHLSPPAELDIYRPSDAILAGANGPPLPTRHCLTEAMQREASAQGARLLVNGSYGEMSWTARLGFHAVSNPLRNFLVRVKRTLTLSQARSERSPFHVRLAQPRLTALPEEIQAAQQVAEGRALAPGRHDLFGYMTGIEKALDHPNEFYAGALRMDFPYRDLRLLRLFAGFPMSLLLDETADRGMARRVLGGRLPDSVRLRRSGLPASPDHLTRMRRQAPVARGRIAAFRKAEIDDWLDLDWLDENLQRVGRQGVADYTDANDVQLTAIVAEFLTWWRERR
jgi:asparagine synthase (glutamine-hydrolysing)